MSEPKHDETFKVVDRRLFSETGELRQEVVDEERRRDEAQAMAQATAQTAAAANAAPAVAPGPPREAPKASLAFKTLIGFLAQNAEMVLRGIPDPRTGRPMLDTESLRQIIDMIDAMKEKSEGNRTDEETQILTELLNDLKYTWVQVQAQAAAPAVKQNPTSRKP